MSEAWRSAVVAYGVAACGGNVPTAVVAEPVAVAVAPSVDGGEPEETRSSYCEYDELPEPLAWRCRVAEGLMIGNGDVVAAVSDDGRHVVGLSARSGMERWRVAPPAGLHWATLQTIAVGDGWAALARADVSTERMGYAHESYAAIDASGHVLWTLKAPNEPPLAASVWGSAFVQLESHGCEARFVDTRTGRWVAGRYTPAPLYGPLAQRCTPWVLGMASVGVVMMTTDPSTSVSTLLAFNDGVRWSHAFESSYAPAIVTPLREADSMVVAQGRELVRVDLPDGNVRWRYVLSDTCEGAEGTPLVTRHDDVGGEYVGLLLCRSAALVDAATGAARWDMEMHDLALLSDPGQQLGLRIDIVGDHTLEWISMAGELGARVQLPPGLRGLVRGPRGVAVWSMDDRAVSLIDTDAETLWVERAPESAGVIIDGEVFEGGSGRQWLIDTTTGKARVATLEVDSADVVHRVSDAAPQWVVQAEKHLMGVRLR
jgi:hypothetical protein